MTEEELSIWFIDKLNSCYPLIDKKEADIIYWCYDKSYVRHKKLCILNNKEMSPNKTDNIILSTQLFTQDIRNKYLYCDYDLIWCHFKKNYSEHYTEIYKLINKILNKTKKFNGYHSCCE